jgi:pimeloyl-ACP methyl ester carboxylesterase
MKRGFIDVGGRLVHYRRLGSGPALVMLHGSPNSSLKLVALMNALAGDFDCIALDTPGNGLSEPLGLAAPATDDYAQALGATLDAAGLGRVALYGFHTGAGTAAAYAAQAPERVAALVLDGVACWTKAEQRGILEGYLPAFAPAFDGAHLAWLWARIVEQTVFFPWHVRTAATRMDYDLHPPEAVHETVMEFLEAGDHYRKPYAAALAGDGAARVRRLRAPTLATAHPQDPIAHHLERIGKVDPAVEIRRAGEADPAAIRRGFLEFLKRHPAAPAPAISDPDRRGFVATPKGAMSYRAAAGGGRPLLLLHEAGGSLRSFAAELSQFGGRRVVALDLPGHGDSAAGPVGSVAAIADAVAAAAGALRIADFDVAGRHLGGAVAVELKARGFARAAAVIGAAHFDEAERSELAGRLVPDLAPRWDGAHLLTAWRYLRHRALFDPWFARARAFAVAGEPDLDAERLHRRCVDLLKSAPHHAAAFDAWLAYPLAGHMTRSDVRRVILEPGDPMSAPRRRDALAAALGGGAEFRDIGTGRGGLAAALERLDP